MSPMTTPNISEAARRAAVEFIAHRDDNVSRQIDQLERIIQSALDSAHPAPKEGEEDPELTEDFHAVYKEMVARGDTIRSLELRLAEKTREAEEYRMRNECSQAALMHKTTEADSLRFQLKKANELLGEANDGLDSWTTGCAPESEILVCNCCEKRRCDETCARHKLTERIRTHLNQQSK